MKKAATPLYLPHPGETTDGSRSVALHLSEKGGEKFSYSEEWLQKLIMRNPELLPVSEIEPALETMIPVCSELPTASGFLDNLYVTPTGYLILVECKLWRNPESRRKVVAQIIDYAKDMTRWSYSHLTDAINRANKTRDENPLYEIAARSMDALDEVEFTDRVLRNLRRGRHMLLIVGDGIQEELVAMSEYLQQFMGLHFALALIEMRLYQIPGHEGIVVIPEIIGKTVNIERAVVRLEDGRPTIDAPSKAAAVPDCEGRDMSLSEEEYFRLLSKKTPEGIGILKRILPRMELLGVSWEIKKSLIFRYSPDGENSFTLGYIEPNGKFWTSSATWRLNALGKVGIAHAYLRDLAAVFEGGKVKEYADPRQWNVMVGEHTLNISDLDGKENAFLKVIERFLLSINAAMQ